MKEHMKRQLTALLLATLFAVPGIAAKSSPQVCTLTGKTVAKCCCITKDSKLYCTLAKKHIESCCCKANK